MSMSLAAASEVFRHAMRDTIRKHSLWYMIEGALLVIAGIVAIMYPFFSSVAVIVMLGWLLILSGVAQGISLIGAKQAPHFWLQMISIILSVLIGFLFLRDPAQSLLTVTLLLLVFFLMEGVSKIIFALTIRPLPNWGWVLASGVLSVVLAGILWGDLPVTAIWLIGLMLGIQLIGTGSAIGLLAWRIRRGVA
jgi:uncharacterized membrane protein HdeD (DUF308 family)